MKKSLINRIGRGVRDIGLPIAVGLALLGCDRNPDLDWQFEGENPDDSREYSFKHTNGQQGKYFIFNKADGQAYFTEYLDVDGDSIVDVEYSGELGGDTIYKADVSDQNKHLRNLKGGTQ